MTVLCKFHVCPQSKSKVQNKHKIFENRYQKFLQLKTGFIHLTEVVSAAHV